jgi:hypothetical protein
MFPTEHRQVPELWEPPDQQSHSSPFLCSANFAQDSLNQLAIISTQGHVTFHRHGKGGIRWPPGQIQLGHEF